jgi:hypothetical protein
VADGRRLVGLSRQDTRSDQEPPGPPGRDGRDGVSGARGMLSRGPSEVEDLC